VITKIGRPVSASLAMEQADRRLGWQKRPAPLLLGISLEPCLMSVNVTGYWSSPVNVTGYWSRSWSDTCSFGCLA
jgi:hypothetical protein